MTNRNKVAALINMVLRGTQGEANNAKRILERHGINPATYKFYDYELRRSGIIIDEWLDENFNIRTEAEIADIRSKRDEEARQAKQERASRQDAVRDAWKKATPKEKKKAPKPERINHPKPGTTCWDIWNVLDAMRHNDGVPSRKEAVAKLTELFYNKATAGTQYRRWAIYNGVYKKAH